MIPYDHVLFTSKNQQSVTDTYQKYLDIVRKSFNLHEKTCTKKAIVLLEVRRF